jgi:hypothetical protein
MTFLSSQILFTSTAGTYGHSLVTQATIGQNVGNSIDFFLWNATTSATTPGTLQALSIAAGMSGSTASFHVMPVGTPTAELEVSDGNTTGGGTLEYGSSGQFSSREMKTDIAYWGPDRAAQAYAEVQALKPARFRYRSRVRGALARDESQPLRRGLIFEDTPESVRGPGNTVVLDYRVLNLELALQAADGKIAAMEKQIAELEAKKKVRKK